MRTFVNLNGFECRTEVQQKNHVCITIVLRLKKQTNPNDDVIER